MRTIRKGQEPASLTGHRKKSYADYDNYADKDDLRKALVAEQRGLCCYCQSRIRADEDEMKIEHWQSQTGFPARQLDYSNLIGACLGGEGRAAKDQHCDSHKGNLVLCFSVSDTARPIERKIKFLGNGQIKSDDATIDVALNNVLNLNWSRLVSNRKAVLDAFKQRLGKGALNVAQELNKWDGTKTGELPEFAQVMVFWLEKRMSRATK
jgi:uncharacterized protein (TIGR02646 family)